MTDLLKKPNNQRIPKKRHKNTRTCTTDEGRFGKEPWITLQAAAFTEQHVYRFLKVHGLKYLGARPCSLGNFEQF